MLLDRPVPVRAQKKLRHVCNIRLFTSSILRPGAPCLGPTCLFLQNQCEQEEHLTLSPSFNTLTSYIRGSPSEAEGSRMNRLHRCHCCLLPPSIWKPPGHRHSSYRWALCESVRARKVLLVSAPISPLDLWVSISRRGLSFRCTRPPRLLHAPTSILSCTCTFAARAQHVVCRITFFP